VGQFPKLQDSPETPCLEKSAKFRVCRGGIPGISATSEGVMVEGERNGIDLTTGISCSGVRGSRVSVPKEIRVGEFSERP
jgi:hypothetical protein